MILGSHSKAQTWLTGFDAFTGLAAVGEFHLGFETVKPRKKIALRRVGKQFHVVIM